MFALRPRLRLPQYSCFRLFRTSATIALGGRSLIPSQLDNVEDVEDYCPGGLHPIYIGDCFAQGRYRVLHKLGYGASSTIWLARDHGGLEPGTLVTLKALRANDSSADPSAMPALSIPKMLQSASPPCTDIQVINHHFVVQGPNGSHLFLVSPFAGPSVRDMSESPGRVDGSRRLRGDLARKVAKQITTTVDCMHRAGVVHGDLTTSNMLFSVQPEVPRWSDIELYANFGEPEIEIVRTVGGGPLPLSAPTKLVAPIDNAKLTAAYFLQESVILTDFSQSRVVAGPPQDYNLRTLLNYAPPEALFEGRLDFEGDVWELGCAIFEIRAGSALFSSFMGEADIIRQMIEILGHLPDNWWQAFREQTLSWLSAGRDPESIEDLENEVVFPQSRKSSIRERLQSIGTRDDAPYCDEGAMIEKTDVQLREEEVALLGDLLEKMLKYRPEERIKMHDVIKHPWFALSD